MRNRKDSNYKSQIYWQKIFYKKNLLRILTIKILSQSNLLLPKIQVKKPINYCYKICKITNKRSGTSLKVWIKKKIFTSYQKKLLIIFIFNFFSQIQNLKAEILVENIKNDSSVQNISGDSSLQNSNLDANKNLLDKGNFDINNATLISNQKSSFDYGLSLAIGKKFSVNIFGSDIILYNQIFGAKNLGSTDFVNNFYGYKLIFAKKIQKFYYGVDASFAKINYQNIINKNNPKYSIPIGLVAGFELSEKINFQINLTNNYLAQKLQKQKTQINQLTMGLVYDF